MTLEEVIIVHSNAPISKLWGPAQKALNEPTSGITVNVPAAVAVIRDCALITTKYLPFYVFGLYGNPYLELKGKMVLCQIKEFVERAKIDFITHQLLELMLARAGTMPESLLALGAGVSDPYQDYESANVQNEHNEIYILSKLFGVV
jgi:hypothetical protein